MEQAIITEKRSGRFMPSVPARTKVQRKPDWQDEFTITPELQAQINRVRSEYLEGKGVTLCTPEEIEAYVESL